MKRREFLMTAAAAAGLAAPAFALRATAGKRGAMAQGKPKSSTLDRIAIMTLNFQRLLRLPDLPAEPERTLELFDLPSMLADTYGVHKIEFQHYHIPSTEPSFLKELRSRIEKHKSRMTQINLEFGNLNMSAPELRNRLMATDLTKMWVDHAVMLGAARVMINQGQPTHENKVYGIPTLKNMADYGKSKGIIVSAETRGGGGGGGGATTAPARRRCAHRDRRGRHRSLARRVGCCSRRSSKRPVPTPTSMSAGPAPPTRRSCTPVSNGCSPPRPTACTRGSTRTGISRRQ